MRTVQYEPARFRRWHDGPVVVIDCQGVGSAIDTQGATYIAIDSQSDAVSYLNMLRRPFVGTIYVFADEQHVSFLASEFADLDIVHVKL